MAAPGEQEAGELEPCAGCALPPSPTLPVTWSPAFGQYLCQNCRRRRTEAELGATDRANAEARTAARRQAAVSRMFPGRRR